MFADGCVCVVGYHFMSINNVAYIMQSDIQNHWYHTDFALYQDHSWIVSCNLTSNIRKRVKTEQIAQCAPALHPCQSV